MTTAHTRAEARGPQLDDAFDLELERMALAVSEEQERPLEEPREPGLSRYLQYQARDFVKHRGVIIFALSMIGLWIFNYNYDAELLQRTARGRPIDGEAEARLFRNIVMGASLLLGGLGSLISAAGIVSRDREGGHQKFLFAKPVRITRFYLQAFAVNGVGLMLTALLVLLATSAVFLRPVPMFDALLAIGATYGAVGGLTFLLSTLVRFDLAAALALSALAVPLQQAAHQGRWWAVMTSWLLPPTYMLEAFGENGNGVNRYSVWQSVGSLLAYGGAYVAIGLAVLKRRSIIR